MDIPKLQKCADDINDILYQAKWKNLTNEEMAELERRAFYRFEYTFTSLCRKLEAEHMNELAAENSKPLQELDNSEYKKTWDKMFTQVPNGLFKFEKYGEGYRAVLPMLVSYRSKTSKVYPVKSRFAAYVFTSLLEQNSHIITRMEEATILFVFHQKEQNHIIRDNDNSDSHDIINLISKYILSTDDNGLRVSLAYESCVSELEIPYTEVYILPKKDLRAVYQ